MRVATKSRFNEQTKDAYEKIMKKKEQVINKLMIELELYTKYLRHVMILLYEISLCYHEAVACVDDE